MGYNFHIKCLVCLKCNKNLHGGEFIVMNTDDPYCQSCYEAVSTLFNRASLLFYANIYGPLIKYIFSHLKNAASVVKQSKLVFCVPLVRFIIQSVSNAPTVNASWTVFHSLKILKKEPIASLAIKSKLFYFSDPEHPHSDTN